MVMLMSDNDGTKYQSLLELPYDELILMREMMATKNVTEIKEYEKNK